MTNDDNPRYRVDRAEIRTLTATIEALKIDNRQVTDERDELLRFVDDIQTGKIDPIPRRSPRPQPTERRGDVMGRWDRGELRVLTGIAGVNAWRVAEGAARYEHPTLVFSTHLSLDRFARYALHTLAEVDLTEAMANDLSPAVRTKMDELSAELALVHIIAETTDLNTLRKQSAETVRRHAVELIVIDHAQLLTSGNDPGTGQRLAATLSALAMELNVAVVAIEEVDSFGDRGPFSMLALRSS